MSILYTKKGGNTFTFVSITIILELKMEEIKLKAEKLLQKCETVVIASVNAEGYPRPVPIAKIT